MIGGLSAWLRRLLSSPCASLGIIALALALASPSLSVGLVADDVVHQVMLREPPGLHGMSRQPFDLFRFASGDSRNAYNLMNEGVFAWWTNPSAVLAFFRPLSSLTHWFDHRVWPNHPWLMHLHSLAWFALLLLVLAAIYRRFESNRFVAALALLLYALDDARGPVVAWVANRNMIVALALSLPALLAHDRWRREGHRRSAWLAPLALALGFLAGEGAIVVVAYLVAYALCLEQGSWQRRLWSLAGYGAVVFVWRVAYERLGYGSVGSGLYVDPGREPLAFALATLTRLPVLLLGEFALPWSDAWEIYPLLAPMLRGVVMGLAVTLIFVLVWLFRPLWMSSRMFRFWAVGSVLSAIPTCATFPHDRLLMGSCIGGMALLARLFAGVWSRERFGALSRRERGVIGGLAFVHLLLGPVLLPYRTYSVFGANDVIRRAYDSIPSGVGITPKSVILVNPPIEPFAAYFSIYREAAQRYRPRRLLAFASGVTELRITRVDARTLRMQPKDGLWSNSTQLMLRSLDRPIPVGERAVLDDASFEVTAVTGDGRPLEILIRFRLNLEDPTLEWLQWGSHGYVPFRPPALGTSVVVPTVDMRAALFG